MNAVDETRVDSPSCPEFKSLTETTQSLRSFSQIMSRNVLFTRRNRYGCSLDVLIQLFFRYQLSAQSGVSSSITVALSGITSSSRRERSLLHWMGACLRTPFQSSRGQILRSPASETHVGSGTPISDESVEKIIEDRVMDSVCAVRLSWLQEAQKIRSPRYWIHVWRLTLEVSYSRLLLKKNYLIFKTDLSHKGSSLRRSLDSLGRNRFTWEK